MILAGTDGLFDNLFIREVLQTIHDYKSSLSKQGSNQVHQPRLWKQSQAEELAKILTLKAREKFLLGKQAFKEKQQRILQKLQSDELGIQSSQLDFESQQSSDDDYKMKQAESPYQRKFQRYFNMKWEVSNHIHLEHLLTDSILQRGGKEDDITAVVSFVRKIKKKSSTHLFKQL